MALMMDNKPTEYKGEALVWEKLSSLLPNDVVVYNHREVVDDREFDFTLLIKNVGIMVIEVKGWQSQYIFDVKGPDEIVIQGESQIYGSPEKQARGYRFDWLNFLNDKFAISPVVLSMVCYPFISEKEYKDVRLDIVSSRDFTIFSDDLNSTTKLGQKISNAFVKKKPLNSTPFDEKAMAIVRQHFEPSYRAKDDQIVEVSDAYSLLKVFNKELTEKDSDELIEMYFAGTKIVAFVKSEIDLLSVCNKLEAGFNARGIISDKGNVRLAEIDERNDFSCVSGSYRIFNFEIYTHNLDLKNEEIIVEGQYTEQQKLILEDVANFTSWNFEQYKVEHAMGDKNVLVQAGAGTGKTYSMVSRIAYLCMSRKRFVDNLVDEIAMVTFTNEAADNMKLRLKQYFMNCYILTKNKKVLHEIEAVDLMQISTIHKFAKAVLQSCAMEYGLGADFAISSSEYAKEKIYEKYLNNFLVEKQKEDANFAQQLRMPVHKFRKLLMHLSQQLYDKRQKDIIKDLSKHHKLSSKDMIIAILVRDNWQIHNILEEAKVRGEFIETQVGGDLYQLMPALDLYKLVIALLNPRDPVNLFNLIDSNYVGIQLDIQGLHGLGTEEQVKKLTDVLNQYFTTVINTTWEKIIMDTKVQPILMLLRSIYEGWRL